MFVYVFVAAPPLSVDRVMNALGELAEHWRDVGGELDIPDTALSAIEADNPTKKDCLKGAVRFCLYRCQFASWRHIISTLDYMSGDSDYEDYHDDLKRVYTKMRPYAERLTGQSVLTTQPPCSLCVYGYCGYTVEPLNVDSLKCKNLYFYLSRYKNLYRALQCISMLLK